MSKQILSTELAPSSPLFSQGVKVGSVIHVSGMTGTDVATGKLAGPSIQEQTRSNSSKGWLIARTSSCCG